MVGATGLEPVQIHCKQIPLQSQKMGFPDCKANFTLLPHHYFYDKIMRIISVSW